MNISFGKKIPIMQCQVQSLKTGNFVPSTVYEYDCKDNNDAFDINDIDGYWIFKPQIFHQALDKTQLPKKYINTRIYSLETKQGETLGMMVTDKDKENNDIDVLENKFMSGYKYVGTNLITAAAQETLKQDYEKLTIKHPIPEVRTFYIEKCGFRETDTRPLELNREELPELIKHTEAKTKTKIIDLKG